MARLDPTMEEHLRREHEQEAETLALIEQLLLDGDPWGATGVGIDYGLWDQVPGILHRLWVAGRIPDAELALALSEVWIFNKAPLDCLGQRAWVSMFKATGYLCRASSTTGVTSPYPMDWHEERPTEPVTVWRGARSGSGGKGMSWSSYRACAMEFAQGKADVWGAGTLYRATVPGRAVLAQFVDFREQEVVVNPDFLRGRIQVDVEVTESAEHAALRTETLAVVGGVIRVV